MNCNEVLERAREIIGKRCRVCKDCNGVACRGEIPGVGGKGTGSSFIRNREKLNEIKINLDTIADGGKVDTSTELFGQVFKYPIFAAPIGATEISYSEQLNDMIHGRAIIEGCKKAGIIGFTGDGAKDEYFEMPIQVIKENGGHGIPTIKPWRKEEIIRKIKVAEDVGATAVAIDIDAAGLILLSLLGKPVSTKPVNELREIVNSTSLPVILKGIMTVNGARKALEAGVYGIIVSNHGGRVMDHTPSTIEVLPEISAEVKGKMKILIDGGFRSGEDVFKALALGADAVLIGRPFAIVAAGGGAEGVMLYTEKLGKELTETMVMTGCHKLEDINSSKLYKF